MTVSCVNACSLQALNYHCTSPHHSAECPRLCRGLYFQQMPFQCNGTIEKLTLQCSITSKTPPKIRLFLIREGGNTSQPFHTEKIVDSRWNFTVHPINENYQPGDTIAYYFNSQEEAKLAFQMMFQIINSPLMQLLAPLQLYPTEHYL